MLLFFAIWHAIDIYRQVLICNINYASIINMYLLCSCFLQYGMPLIFKGKYYNLIAILTVFPSLVYILYTFKYYNLIIKLTVFLSLIYILFTGKY